MCVQAYLILLCFALLHFFLKKRIEGSWQPCIEQVCRHHFPAAGAHFAFLCHSVVIQNYHNLSDIFIIIMLW